MLPQHSSIAPSGAGSAAGKSILLADDDPTLRVVMRRVLASRGYTVQEAADGRVALALLHDQRFDLVITDLVMPELEGLEVIQALRKQSRSIAILAVSGAYAGTFLHAAQLLGATATLSKPFDPDTLLATVQRLIGEPV